MFLKQYYLGCLAHASYLLADQATRTAVVVDPQRDIQQYLADAQQHGFTIRHVFLTHFHADFVAGHLELRDRCGAAIHLGARAHAEYPFTPMRDGDTLAFPGLRLQTLETPGHTIESICLLVFDPARDPLHPHAVLTGDTLFIGDVGRPDLRASLGWSAADLGAHLYRSLRDKLLPLPDPTLIYPAHGAGSLCGKSLSSETVSTLGEQRRFNYALRPMSEDQFVALVTADQPEAPPYFTYDAILNTRERPTLDRTLEQVLHPLTLDQLLHAAAPVQDHPNTSPANQTERSQAAQALIAQLLDVRDPDPFARAHLAGSLNIGLNGQFATWAGTLLDQDRPIVLIAAPGREQEAALRLGRIGFDRILGYLRGGMEALADRPDLLASTERAAAPDLARRLGLIHASGTAPEQAGLEGARLQPSRNRQESAGALAPQAALHPPFILDVRSPREWESRRIAGSVNLPLSRLRGHLDEIPRDRRILIHCAGGYRSSIAASLLLRAGIANLVEMSGGLAAWDAAQLPVLTAAAQAVIT